MGPWIILQLFLNVRHGWSVDLQQKYEPRQRRLSPRVLVGKHHIFFLWHHMSNKYIATTILKYKKACSKNETVKSKTTCARNSAKTP